MYEKDKPGQPRLVGLENLTDDELLSDKLIDFGPITYLVRDFEQYGEWQSESRQRMLNEMQGDVLEGLGEPFRSRYSFKLDSQGVLVAENGESFLALNQRGLMAKRQEQRVRPELAPVVRRFEADVRNAQILNDFMLDPNIPVGEALLIISAAPDANEMPAHLAKNQNYRADVKQAMVWMGRKTSPHDLELSTVNLFEASLPRLSKLASELSGQQGQFTSTAETPWRQFRVQAPRSDVNQVRRAYDAICEAELGEQTWHGLVGTETQADTWAFACSPELQTAIKATQQMYEQVATSIITGMSDIPDSYLEGILSLKRYGGDFEVVGERRQALMRLRNGHHMDDDSYHLALQTAYQAARNSLWATARKLYDEPTLFIQPDHLHGHSIELIDEAFQSVHRVHIPVSSRGMLNTLSEVRQSGRAQFGCPGSGSGEEEQGLFGMTEGEAKQAIYGTEGQGRPKFGRCPGCSDVVKIDYKDMSGKVSCPKCEYAVETCSGKVLHASTAEQKRQAEREQRRSGFFGRLLGWSEAKAPKASDVEQEK